MAQWLKGLHEDQISGPQNPCKYQVSVVAYL